MGPALRLDTEALRQAKRSPNTNFNTANTSKGSDCDAETEAPDKEENVECKSARREAKEKDTDIEMAKQAENAERWGRIFLETPLEATAFDAKEPLQKSMIEYAEQMGIPTEGNALTDNMARWGKTLSAYVYEKCGETPPQTGLKAGRCLGTAPALKLQKLAKPKGGDLRDLVLPGGGDLCPGYGRGCEE